MIRADDDSLYTGVTTDVARRFTEHAGKARGARFFNGRKPVEVVYTESGHTRSTACQREAEIKKLTRLQKTKLLQAETLEVIPMKTDERVSFEGGCTCGKVRYQLTSKPLIVHCCHCRWCQRESGAAFALNAMIESDRVELLKGSPAVIETPSNSGKGQKVSRCPDCQVTVWSHYAGAGDTLRFVRVGTLDEPDLLPPDIHIFTESKQPWVVLPEGAPAMPVYYSAKEHWPQESLERMRDLDKR